MATVDEPIETERRPSSGALTYGLILQGPESTVCSEAPAVPAAGDAYQSEAALEEGLLRVLTSQGYDRLRVDSEAGLVANLRARVEELNGIVFTDAEWARFCSGYVTNPALTVIDKTRRIQNDPVIAFERDDGSVKNVYLLDREHIHRNRLQVMNQYEAGDGAHLNRYDVTILVNGLPLAHIELKRRGVRLREAFNQIERYQRESFWSGSGLFEFVQVFVISNGTSTKYYGNTVRWEHTHPKRGRRGVASFEFTSWWTDANNRRIADLEGFARTFLSRGTLLMVLTHYCVLTAEDEPKLLVMRPYQICATERILNRILISEYDRKRLGTTDAGGYIWHTTGSGKTLTSFKCAQLASRMEGVDKVLFVVDRKDLDYQTMKEYNRFQKDAVNGSEDTRALDENLRDDTKRICVTTIQKLSVLISRNQTHPIYDRHVVFIFDECHRSQFGRMHREIIRKFRNYHLFGFTGTPIFAKNANMSGDPTLRTTEQAFGDRLHSYTIVDAIADGNVLPFRVSYLQTMRQSADSDAQGELVEAIDREGAIVSEARIAMNAAYILRHFGQATMRRADGTGFTSILATDGIPAARRYYRALTEQEDEMERAGTLRHRLRIAMIYSYAPNGDDLATGIIADESMDAAGLPASDREALEQAIGDYNRMFGTSYSTDGARFQNYYKDVSQRLKNREIDLLIVVDMFLTGFDSKTLNTLWVDKNLRMHGLIQAFSRTNRILDSVKTFGNVVCFRDLSKQVDEALELFGDRDAAGIVVLKPYREYLGQYLELVDEITRKYVRDGAVSVVGEAAEKGFVGAFGALLKLRNVLGVFDEFPADDPLSDRLLQDLQGVYLDIGDKLKSRAKAEKSDIVDDLVFEIELIRQVEVGVDYILELVAKAHGGNGEDRTAYDRIRRAVASSPQLRDKADLILEFVERMGVSPDGARHEDGGLEERRRRVDDAWHTYLGGQVERELDGLIAEERLKPEQTRRILSIAFDGDGVPETGALIGECMPRMSRFTKGNAYLEQRHRIIHKLQAFYDKYKTLVRSYPLDEENGSK
ncbi:HsdR family type I site-specific deoxyribonuclease [Bifidobacterium pullorum subsp. gallinarum]|uniref:Type I restriction enzyme endonuclease subunit n=1 Tax=Bifidobacterium pullorum subsp. gallinarum TaxID=78344 RepID=A0A087AM60_9BIFI|nr:type I restriction endonuclease subunit R [Bifidobacterium pullorum]KFI59860.1 HsdR family type I site-specific deoxyribonuclease [Bifidobacterium pullorum subsp. gallinarum]